MKNTQLFKALALSITSLLITASASGSTWVPIRVGEITTFTPLPALEAFEYKNFQSGTSLSVNVGSTANTEAYYYRVINSNTGSLGAWQCSTAAEVAAQGDTVIATTSGGGNYKVEVAACMTGGGCDIPAFSNGSLACSETTASASVEVLDNGVVHTPSASSTVRNYVGSTAGEFRVSESGAATYNVPIALPDGTAGVKPSISLSYNSSAPTGIAGTGWNLNGLSAITRCPKNFVQDGSIVGVTLTKEDRLCLDGQRLVTQGRTTDKGVSDNTYWQASQTYHTELDGFAKIRPHYSSGVLRAFTVETKSGEIHYYGQLRASSGSHIITGQSDLGKNLATTFKNTSGAIEKGEDAFVGLSTNENLPKSWAIKAIKDVKNNYILFRYTENQTTGEHLVNEIQYTGNSSTNLNPYVVAKFNYKDSLRPRLGFFAGGTSSSSHILDNIDVKIDGHSFRKYKLNYASLLAEEDKVRLDGITECVTAGSGDKCLPPLTFKWNSPSTATTFSPFRNTSSSGATTPNATKSKVMDINGDGFADIVFAASGAWKAKLGPSYTTEKHLYSGKANKPEKAQVIDFDGDGVQDLLVANSTTENWTVISHKKQFTQYINHCRYGSCQEEIDVGGKQTNVRASTLDDGVLIADMNGDTLGDIVVGSGKKLLFYKSNGDGTFGSSETIIEFEDETVDTRYNRSVKVYSKGASVLDLNGDGRSDFIFKTLDTYEYCARGNGTAMPSLNIADCREANGEYRQDKRYYLRILVSKGNGAYESWSPLHFSSSESSVDDFQYRITDINGDGLNDIAYRSAGNGNWYYRQSTGTKLQTAQPLRKSADNASIYTKKEHAYLTQLIDLNRDGKADLLAPTTDGKKWNVYIARSYQNNFDVVKYKYRGQYDVREDRTIQFGDANGDGKLDLYQAKGSSWLIQRGGMVGKPENVIEEFITSSGVKTQVKYSYIADSNVYYKKTADEWYDAGTDGETPNDDYFAPISGVFVVSQAKTQTTNTKWNAIKYEYGGLLVHKNGRGMLGFERLRTFDLQSCTGEMEPRYIEDDELGTIFVGEEYVTQLDTCVSTETIYAQRFPYTGMPKETTQRFGSNGAIISKATNDLQVKTTAQKGLFPYIKKSIEKQYLIYNDFSTSTTAHSMTRSDFTYDSWGNLAESTIKTYDGEGGNSFLEVVTDNNFPSSPANYQRFGRLDFTTVTKKRYVNGQLVKHNGSDGVVTRQSSFTYNSDLMLFTETIAPNLANYKVVSTHSYDKFGNKTKISSVGASKKNGSGSQTRTSETEFDPTRGNYVVKTKNAKGHTVTTSITGTNGTNRGRVRYITKSSPNNTTQKTYVNEFGDVIEQQITGSDSNDPTIKTRIYKAFCATNGVDCATSIFDTAYFRVIQAAPGKPEKQAFYDKWGRELGGRVKDFHGNWAVTKVTYDENGNTKRVYEPARNVVSPYFTEYKYDRLKRVVEEKAPRTTTKTEYHGSKVTVTLPNNAKKEVFSNYLGEKYKVVEKDSDGSVLTQLVSYFNASGQLKSVDVYKGTTKSHRQVLNSFDDYGHKIQMDDLDKGVWQYAYNAFGELVEQKSKQNNVDKVSTFTFDSLGRKDTRLDSDGFTKWEYDAANYGQGKLNRVRYFKGKTGVSGTPTYQEQFFYKSQGLVVAKETLVDGESYKVSYGYDSLNRIRHTVYPDNKFQIKQTYNSFGYPEKTINNTPGHREFGTVYQEVEKMDVRNNITKLNLADDLMVENRSYDSDTGWLNSISIYKGNALRHALDYNYYDIGNLKQRINRFASTGSAKNSTETFYYDSLNRLDYSDTVVGSTSFRSDVSYDQLGNIESKTNVGTYHYHGVYKNRLDTVKNSANKVIYDFDYDERGNVKSDGTRTIKYTSFDKPYRVEKNNGGSVVEFFYGINRELYRQKKTINGKVTDSTYIDGMYEKTKLPSGVVEHKYNVGNTVVVDRSNGSYETMYLHKDNLGSAVTVTNRSGNVIQHSNYDAWGKQHSFYENSMFSSYSVPTDSNGYTGHKMVDDVGIIHMNGRIYDPTLGRFLQADPFIQAPSNSQSYNRYAYVLNNPLSYTDPSGYFFKKLWKSASKLWQATTGSLLRAIASIPVLNTAINVGLNFIPGCQVWCSAAFSAATTYAVTGSLKAAFTSGAITAATAYAFSEIGAHFDGLNAGSAGDGLYNFGGNYLTSGQVAQQISAHAIVGGVVADLRGGKFGHGFFSAGLTKGIGGALLPGGSDLSSEEIVKGTVVSAVVGGTASKISGGKFANGAQTGAFQYLFNQGGKYLKKKHAISAAKRLVEAQFKNAEYNKDSSRNSPQGAIIRYDEGGWFTEEGYYIDPQNGLAVNRLVPNGNQMGCEGFTCFIAGPIPINEGATALVVGLPSHYSTESMVDLSAHYQNLANMTNASVHVFGRGKSSGSEWNFRPEK